MFRKKIKYTDFDGEEHIEDFYFNLTKAEVMEMDICYDGGLQGMLEKISKTKDTKVILEIFKDLIRKSYGEKSLDGKRFMKNKEITDSFTCTEAYSELFMEFISDSASATAFVNGIIPHDSDKMPVG